MTNSGNNQSVAIGVTTSGDEIIVDLENEDSQFTGTTNSGATTLASYLIEDLFNNQTPSQDMASKKLRDGATIADAILFMSNIAYADTEKQEE